MAKRPTEPDDPDDFAARATDEQLLEAASSREDGSRARVALKALSRRGHESAARVAQSIVVDASAPDELRSVAAVELGSYADAPTLKALQAALESASPALLKHLFTSIGQVGDAKMLKALDRTKAPPDAPMATLDALEFAKALICYRFGLDAHLIDPGPIAAAAAPATDAALQGHVELGFEPMDRDAFENVLPSLRRKLPAIELDWRGALHFKCGHSDQVIGFTPAATGAGNVERVRREPMVLGVIAKFRPCPGGYGIDEYLLANGGGKDRVMVVGVRATGTRVHAGHIELGRGSVTFQLRANNPPYGRPFNIIGSFNPAGAHVCLTRVAARPGWPMPPAPPLRPAVVPVVDAS